MQLFEKGNHVCVTIVGRNYNKEVIFVWTKPIVEQNPLKAKAHRTLFAISKARELGYKYLMCEGGSLNVICPQ